MPLSSRASLVSLADDQVDVWMAPSTPEGGRAREAYVAVMSDAERRRWKRFLSFDAANQFLMGRALLRTTLSHYTDVAPQDWIFETNSYGKPFIACPRCVTVGFNIAHTTGLVACAIHKTQYVGVDVERIDQRTDYNCLAGLALVDFERRRLESTPESQRLDGLFRFWTLKEAFIKAKGMGLSIPLSSFALDLDFETPRIVFQTADDDLADRWHFREFAPMDGYRMAVAVRLDGSQTLNATARWVSPASSL